MHQSTWSVVVSKCGSIKSLKWTSKVKSYFFSNSKHCGHEILRDTYYN